MPNTDNKITHNCTFIVDDSSDSIYALDPLSSLEIGSDFPGVQLERPNFRGRAHFAQFAAIHHSNRKNGTSEITIRRSD